MLTASDSILLILINRTARRLSHLSHSHKAKSHSINSYLFDQLLVAANNPLTVKSLTNVNFANFFKKVIFGKAFNFITWTRSIVQLLLNKISAEKSPNKAKTANFNGLFSLNIF